MHIQYLAREGERKLKTGWHGRTRKAKTAQDSILIVRLIFCSPSPQGPMQPVPIMIVQSKERSRVEVAGRGQELLRRRKYRARSLASLLFVRQRSLGII